MAEEIIGERTVEEKRIAEEEKIAGMNRLRMTSLSAHRSRLHFLRSPLESKQNKLRRWKAQFDVLLDFRRRHEGRASSLPFLPER